MLADSRSGDKNNIQHFFGAEINCQPKEPAQGASQMSQDRLSRGWGLGMHGSRQMAACQYVWSPTRRLLQVLTHASLPQNEAASP